MITKTILIALTPILLMNACSSKKVEKKIAETSYDTIDIGNLYLSPRALKAESPSIHNSLVISDNQIYDHDFTVNAGTRLKPKKAIADKNNLRLIETKSNTIMIVELKY